MMPAKYIGNYERDIHILNVIKKLIDNDEHIGNNMYLDKCIYEMKKCGLKLDITFDDTLNPLSDDLHDAIFRLIHNELITTDGGIRLTLVGERVIENYHLMETTWRKEP